MKEIRRTSAMNDLPCEDSEQDKTTRRRFLALVIGVLASLNALIVGIPFVGSLIGTSRKRKAEWSRVAPVGSLPEGQPVEVKFQSVAEDAYHYETALFSVWLVRHPGDEVTVFSPNCPHLGCHFIWNDKIEKFACPCHASMFARDGKVLYGPAPRPLDTLPHKIDNGVLFVQYERFRVGTPEKISL
jgi:menaquinol-cytochrome c reductase iron-sulfur subunit